MSHRRSRTLVWIAAACISALGLTACSNAKPSGSTNGPVEIKIGVVGPLTGQFAAVGTSQLNGAALKADELNNSDKSVKITLLSEDDASNCDQSVNATIKLITQEKVAAILGASNSPCALAMVPVTAKYKVPQFTFGVGTAITQQKSQYIFRIAPGAPSQSKSVATYAIKTLNLKRLGVAHTRDEYGASVADGFQAAVKELGGELALREQWTVGDKDFTGLLLKIKQANLDAVFLTGSLADTALVTKQMRDAGMKQQILGDTGMASPDYVKLAGSAANGAIQVEPFTISSPDPKVKAFVDKYKAKHQKDPDSWVAEMYDAVNIIYQAVKKAGKVDPEAIRQYAADLKKSGGHTGILNNVSFDEAGESLFPLYIVQVKDGQKVILKSP